MVKAEDRATGQLVSPSLHNAPLLRCPEHSALCVHARSHPAFQLSRTIVGLLCC